MIVIPPRPVYPIFYIHLKKKIFNIYRSNYYFYSIITISFYVTGFHYFLAVKVFMAIMEIITASIPK